MSLPQDDQDSLFKERQTTSYFGGKRGGQYYVMFKEDCLGSSLALPPHLYYLWDLDQVSKTPVSSSVKGDNART